MPSVINPRSVSVNLNRAEQDGLWFNQGRRLALDFANIFGTQFDESNASSQAAQGNPATLASSVFSGWGSEIGVRQNFDIVKFALFPWKSDELPTQCRVTVRETDASGTILANVICPMPNTAANVPYEVFAELGTTIANSGLSEIYLQVWTNGRVGYGAATETPTSENIRYRTDKGISTSAGAAVSVTNYGEIFAKTFTCGTTAVFTNGAFSAYELTSGTFSGYGTVLSANPGQFNTCQIWLNAFSATRLPTRVRVRFKETDHNGNVLATAIANVSFASTGSQLVTFYFDDDIDLSGYATVWFEFMTDGYVSIPKSDTLSGVTTERYAASGGIDSETVLPFASPTQRQIWVRTALQDRTAGITFDAGQLLRAIQSDNAAVTPEYAPSADVLLPATTYAVENYECNIYIDGAVDSYLPLDALVVTGGTSSTSTGKMESHRYTYTPSGTGSHSVSLSVANNGSVLATDSTTVSYKAESVGNGQTRKALIIGDSIVAGASALISSTLLANVAANGSSTYALTLLGTQGSGANLHEGYNGYSYATFVGVTSPFYYGGMFDFSAYLSANAYTMTTGDHVFLLLGTNDFFNQDTDAEMATAITNAAADMQEMIDSIHSHNANIHIWLGMTPQPAYGQTAWGQTYGGTQANPKRVKRNYALWRRHLIDVYDGLGGSNVRLCPIHCCVDTKNNYTQSTRAVNARNATTETIQSDPVHPATGGRQQIADVLYACLMSRES